MTLGLRVLHIVPFISPILIMGPRLFLGTHPSVAIGIAQTVTIMMTFVVWWLVRGLVLLYRKAAEGRKSAAKDSAARRNNKDLYYLIAAVVAALALVSLLHFAVVSLSENLVPLAALAFGLAALLDLLRLKRLDLFYLPVRFVQTGVVTVLSFLALALVWHWSMMMMGLAFASVVTVAEMADLLSRAGRPEPHQALVSANLSRIVKTYSMLLFAAPCILTLLASMDQIPSAYAATMLTALFSARMVKIARASEITDRLPPDLAAPTVNISLLFVLLLLAITLGLFVTGR